MLRHSEHHHENKMPLHISSSTTNNQWPQMQQQQQHNNNNIQIDDDDRQKTSLIKPMSSSTSSPAVPAQHQALKCPRCDSSNTKFCYYNNYSLSQPRHFCKACKRYWTRGGTLRNVPVGGGCRKNKRVKRPGSSAVDGGGGATSSTSSSAPITTANINSQPPHHLDQIGPLFYGLPSNPFMEFDLQAHQMGLGFSSPAGAIISSGDGYRNRFDIPTSNSNNSSLPSNYSSIFSTSSLSATATATATTAPAMASVLASKFINGGATFSKDYQAARAPPHHNQYFQNLLPFEDLQIAGGGGGGGNGSAKEVKVEDHGGGQNRLDWMNANSSNNGNGNMNHEQMGLSDPNNLYWSSTTSSLGVNWHDPSNNLGSSVPSLI